MRDDKLVPQVMSMDESPRRTGTWRDYAIGVVACNSMVRHSIAGGEYNRRRQECPAAVETLASRHPYVTSLRGVTPVA